MSSQFVYKLACLNSPNEDQYNRYKTSVRNFVWEGKTPKIAYSTLTSGIDDGGVKLVDLEHKDNALKIQWIKRIQKNESLANLAYYFFPQIGEFIWKCNLQHEDVKTIMPKESFWRDVLSAWCKFNFSPKLDLESVLNSIIWFNSEIQIGGTPVFYKRCFNKGIIFLRDILDKRNNTFLTFEALVAKYGQTITFVEYNGLISAIPKTIKQILQQNAPSGQEGISNYEKYIAKSWDSKYFYSMFIENTAVLPNLSAKWEALLHTPINEETLCNTFQTIKIISLSTKLRSFLYRLLHFAVMTNDKLYAWKVVDSELCTFCNVEPETYEHLFWSCPAAKQIWNQIESWCKDKANRNIVTTFKKVMLCKLSTNTFDCINTICLITLQYIYGSRCLKKLPSFAQLKCTILDEQRVEKYIAIKNNKLRKHFGKWQGFE